MNNYPDDTPPDAYDKLCAAAEARDKAAEDRALCLMTDENEMTRLYMDYCEDLAKIHIRFRKDAQGRANAQDSFIKQALIEELKGE